MQMFKNFLLLMWILKHGKTGHSFEITSHFLSGDLVLSWPSVCPYYDVSIQCNGHFRGVSRIHGTRFVVTNVLDCSLIDVVIRCTVNYRYIESERKQFYLKLMVASEGDNVTLRLPSVKTPSHITKYVYHRYYQTVARTFPNYLKDSYVLDITNVTPSDAGYYGIGVTEVEARSSSGVVLVIKASPSIPVISGSYSVLRGETTTLTCNSVSRSKPNYYKKFTTIAYAWFVNKLEVTHDAKSLELTIYTHKTVECQAKEDVVSTSEPFFIEALYGPDSVEMIPAFNDTLTLHDGAYFGPVNCNADCNPPCHFQWKKVTWDGHMYDVNNEATLPKQVVHVKGVMKYRCVVTGFYANSHGSKSVSRELTLNIRCGPECIDMTPDISDTVTLHVGEYFGPVTCTAHCRPPCKYQWRQIMRNGDVNDVINASTLPRQTVRAKGVSGYRCVVSGIHGNSAEETTVSREIFFNIQYLDLPTITSEYNGQITERRIIHAEEGTSILLRCTGIGNPEPDVFIAVVNEPRQAMLSKKSTQNYLMENLKCGDTQCICTAESSGFNNTVTDVFVIVECVPRLDENAKFRRQYHSNMVDNVIVLVPVIAFPKPQNISWIVGPLVAPQYVTEGTITQTEFLNGKRFLVIGDFPASNESIYGNLTLYIDDVEIVTISISKLKSEKAASMWNLSSTLNLLVGSCIGIFCLSCLSCIFYHMIRLKGKNKSHHITRQTGEPTVTYLTGEPTARTSYNEVSEYECLPNPIDNYFENFGTEHAQEDICYIEPVAETYLNDGRMFYKVKTETPGSKVCHGYEEIHAYTDLID